MGVFHISFLEIFSEQPLNHRRQSNYSLKFMHILNIHRSDESWDVTFVRQRRFYLLLPESLHMTLQHAINKTISFLNSNQTFLRASFVVTYWTEMFGSRYIPKKRSSVYGTLANNNECKYWNLLFHLSTIRLVTLAIISWVFSRGSHVLMVATISAIDNSLNIYLISVEEENRRIFEHTLFYFHFSSLRY